MKHHIYFADLTHTVTGMNAPTFPLGVSFVHSYAKKMLEEENYVFVVDYGTTFLSLGFAAVGKRLYAQIAERDWIDVEVEEVCCMDGIGELRLNTSDKSTTDEQYR